MVRPSSSRRSRVYWTHSVRDLVQKNEIVKMLTLQVSLGLDESDSTKSTLDVYRKYFETPFVNATRKYYQDESRQFLAENSVIEYMKKVRNVPNVQQLRHLAKLLQAEIRLLEERQRVSLYLLTEITNPLMKCCEGALVADHSTILRDEFQVLLDNENREDLGRMYKLLARIPDGLDPLRSRFEAHVRKAGLAAVEKVAADGENMEPKVYVESLLEVHTRYQELVQKQFNGESEFVRSLDNACREFVNRNVMCKSASTKSPELLAKYTDALLRRSSAKVSEEDDMETALAQIVSIPTFSNLRSLLTCHVR